MAIQKHTLPTTTTAIWAETANLNYFVSTEITPDSVGEVKNDTTEVAGSSRRQYPGDPTPINVPGTTRIYMVDPGRKSGSAVPGKEFRVSDGTQNRMMRYTGTWIDVHAYFTGNVPAETYLYSPSGTRYVIAAPEAALVAKAKAPAPKKVD